MKPSNRLRTGLIGLVVLVTGGTAAYVLLEDAAPLDALYFVFITITTVGYSEAIDLSDAGRILTMGMIMAGVGLAFYTAGAGIEQLFAVGESRKRARTSRMISSISDHTILCGFGRVGRGTWEALSRRGVDVVVVERDPEFARMARELGAVVVEADATRNESLLEANVLEARSLIACVTLDSDNLVIILSARSLRPDLHLVSRASEPESDEKIRLAGADRVVTPQAVGSERLAAMATEMSMADVFDVFVGGRAVEFVVEELRIQPGSSVVGRTIREAGIRETTGALILAAETADRKSLTTPDPDQVLGADSYLVVVGTDAQIRSVERLFSADDH